MSNIFHFLFLLVSTGVILWTWFESRKGICTQNIPKRHRISVLHELRNHVLVVSYQKLVAEIRQTLEVYVIGFTTWSISLTFFCCFSWCAAMTFMEKMHQVVVGGLAGRRTSIPRAIRHGQLSRVGDSKQLAARWPPGGPWYPYLYPFHSRTSNRLSFLVKHGFLETSGDTHLS